MTTRDRVIRVIAEELGSAPHELAPGATLVDELGADSLHLIELALALEAEFELDMIPDDDMWQFRTVDDVVRYVESRTAAGV